MPLNRTKFQHAVLYFLHKSNPAVMGRVKLMKLLYYLDFDHLSPSSSSVIVMIQRTSAPPMPGSGIRSTARFSTICDSA